MTGAEAVARAMKTCGVDKFFFVMGGMPVAEAVSEEGVKIHLCHNEKAATNMADGYARVTRKPVVCYSQHGAAAAILASVMYEPLFAHSPVIALTGSTPTALKDTWRYQECYEMKYFEQTCKFNVDVTDTCRLAEYMRTAAQIAVSGCPGPVHVNMHLDMATKKAEMPEIHGHEIFFKIPPFRPRAEPKRIAEAANLLANAKRPVIVCGSGIHLSRAYSEVKELAELLQIPVATNPKGKGCFPEDHLLSIGVTGIYGSTFANDAIRESDLVFFIATRAGSHMTEDFTAPEPGASKIIHLDIDPLAIGRNYKTDVALVGDARETLRGLLKVLKAKIRKAKKNEQRLSELSKAAGKYESKLEGLMSSEALPIKPQRIIKEVMKVLGPRDILVSDTGQSLVWTARLIKLKSVGMHFTASFGTLGSSFAISIGAAFGAEKDQRVLNFIGDGGMGYNLTDLETARRYQEELSPLVVLVNNNSSLSMGRPGRDEDWSRIEPPWIDSTDFAPLNYAKIAQDFGCHGVRVERPGEIEEALRNAFDSGKPAVVDIVSDKREYAPIGYMRKTSEERTKEKYGISIVY